MRATAAASSYLARAPATTGSPVGSFRAYLGVGLAASISILAIPPGPVRDVAYAVIGASSVAAILVGNRRNRPRARIA